MSVSQHSHPDAVVSHTSVWGCFGSCMGLVKGQVQRKGEESGPGGVGGASVSGCSPHTSFRGHLWAHSPLHRVGSSLCFPSLSPGLMNRPLATVGLSVSASTEDENWSGIKKGDFIKGWDGANIRGDVILLLDTGMSKVSFNQQWRRGAYCLLSNLPQYLEIPKLRTKSKLKHETCNYE